MHLKDMTTLRIALIDFIEQVAALGPEVDVIATHRSSGRYVEAADFVVPAFMPRDSIPNAARFRVSGTGSIALRRVLADWVPPNLEDVIDVGPITAQDVHQARVRFLEAVAAVAVELAVHSRPTTYDTGDRSYWWRTDPTDFPEQARELVPAAQAALTECAVLHLKRMGMMGAPFMPGARGAA